MWTTLWKPDLQGNSFRIIQITELQQKVTGTCALSEPCWSPILLYTCPTSPQSYGPCPLSSTQDVRSQRELLSFPMSPISLHHTFPNSASVLTTHHQTPLLDDATNGSAKCTGTHNCICNDKTCWNLRMYSQLWTFLTLWNVPGTL